MNDLSALFTRAVSAVAIVAGLSPLLGGAGLVDGITLGLVLGTAGHFVDRRALPALGNPLTTLVDFLLAMVIVLALGGILPGLAPGLEGALLLGLVFALVECSRHVTCGLRDRGPP